MRKTHTANFSKKYKIRNVLLAYYLAPLIILLNASSIYFYFSSKESLDQELGERLLSIASFAAMQVKAYHVTALSTHDSKSKTYEMLRSKFEEIRAANKMEKIYIFAADSRSLLDTDASVSPGTIYERHRLYKSELEKAQEGTPVASVLFQGRDGQYFKTAFTPIIHEGKSIAFVGVDGSADFFSNLQGLGKALTYFGLICISLVVVSSLLVSRKIVTPVENLVQSAERIGEGKLNAPIDLKINNEIGFLGYAMDEMRKKIVERDTELQMMLQGVAHEVRNPLGGIELFAGLLKEEIQDPKQESHILRIQKEIQILKQLVQEFLDFARKTPLEMNTTNLGHFFEELRPSFSQEVASKNLKMIFDVPPGMDAFFDAYQMRRVFLNLIHNAIQACGLGGEIFIKADVQGGFLVFSIRDNGTGISKPNLELIFNPFFTTKERGSGLGLAFVKKIVQAHGGKIEVESESGQGTTFYILLPT